ncbi:MAG: nicotinate (nicotinamide) nucleotide adenylyltransferase [Lentisphaerae bacterium RIFOXYB12_FULL_65_16]|nr:MAG: nicotinate (nicotinamide) nucleotide adenylyltransferase [Lentisphaerae bacterium RIFOXYA12_64_32]OGV90514.1 MAG: nicotinate (nicotinamide) nucleotide adenylyltransferase [Lentisphaerae bacterium RIFOXYB12_FULL_65_16]
MTPSRRPRLAVFGGSFDPVHNGHLFVAGEMVRGGHADEVLFVPARQPPHKIDLDLAPANHRLAMLRLALAFYPEFSVSDIELSREAGPSYTFDTLETLRQVFPEHEIRFLLGMDNLIDLHRWYRATELVQHYELLIYPRPGVSTPSFAALAAHFGDRMARKLAKSVVALPEMPVVATEIRADLVRGRTVAGRCPESVLGYIRDHGLYGSRPA